MAYTKNKRVLVRYEIDDICETMDEAIRRCVFELFFTIKPKGRDIDLDLCVLYFIITKHQRGELNVEANSRRTDEVYYQIAN